MAIVLYGVVIRDAIKSKNIRTMKAVASKAARLIRDQKDLHAALLDLQDAIEKLEKK